MAMDIASGDIVAVCAKYNAFFLVPTRLSHSMKMILTF